MRTSPRFAYSVPKIGKGSLCPPSDPAPVFSLAGALASTPSSMGPGHDYLLLVRARLFFAARRAREACVGPARCDYTL